jgi:hypothetical protein
VAFVKNRSNFRTKLRMNSHRDKKKKDCWGLGMEHGMPNRQPRVFMISCLRCAGGGVATNLRYRIRVRAPKPFGLLFVLMGLMPPEIDS